MARQRRRPSGPSGDDPRPRNRSRSSRSSPDISTFLHEPIGSMTDEQFDQLCTRLIRVLGPTGVIEEAMAGQIIWSFRSVRRAVRALDAGVSGADRYYRSMLRSFRTSQECFDLARRLSETSNTRNPPPEPAEPTAPEPSPSIEPPPPPEPDEPDPDFEVEEIESAAREWRNRIAMVPAIDARWPIVDRLGLLVDDLLRMRDGGTSDDEILEQHPGLTYSDLAACYACESDGYRGPLEPPYPDDLAVIDDDAPDDEGE